jgi:hypothetical protein
MSNQYKEALEAFLNNVDLDGHVYPKGKTSINDAISIFTPEQHKVITKALQMAHDGGWNFDISQAPKDEELKLKTKYFECIGFYDTADSSWFFPLIVNEDYQKINFKIIAWMPLPALPTPPKESE